MTNLFKKEIEEVKKGCGENVDLTYNDGDREFEEWGVCGSDCLCPTCKKELSRLEKDEKIVNEKVEMLNKQKFASIKVKDIPEKLRYTLLVSMGIKVSDMVDFNKIFGDVK